MERILVGIDDQHGSWEALKRAVSLSERIEAAVYVLLVLPEEKGAPRAYRDQELERSVRGRLELLQRGAGHPGRIELFLVTGNYEEEVIRFADQYRITLLVVEQDDAPGAKPGRSSLSIEKIRHRLTCRVELITPKRSN